MDKDKYIDLNLNKLINMSRGDNSFLEKIICVFLEETPKSIELLNKHYNNKEYDRIRAVAHKMKPSIDLLDIELIKQDIRDLENYAESKTNIKKIQRLIEKITTICNTVVSQLKK